MKIFISILMAALAVLGFGMFITAAAFTPSGQDPLREDKELGYGSDTNLDRLVR